MFTHFSYLLNNYTILVPIEQLHISQTYWTITHFSHFANSDIFATYTSIYKQKEQLLRTDYNTLWRQFIALWFYIHRNCPASIREKYHEFGGKINWQRLISQEFQNLVVWSQTKTSYIVPMDAQNSRYFRFSESKIDTKLCFTEKTPFLVALSR